VKVHAFHLMPYQALPEDFTQRYRSVWVDVPSELFDAAAAHRMYNEYLDTLELADELGFDGICVNEHHANAYGLMPSPNLMAAALARRTSRAALVVLGNSLALYNPPIRVAEEFAMLDCLSGGRLVAGFPLGTPMDTTYAYGQVPTTLREKYAEAHDLVLQSWLRPEPFVFNGKYTQLRYVNIWPRPLQKPHPPIWIPGSGSVETWEWVAARDYVYCYLSYYGYKRAQATMAGYWETLERLGAEPNPYRGGFLQLVAVAESDAAAERAYAPHADYFYNRCLHVYDGWADPPGYRTPRSLQRGLGSQLASQASQARGALGWRELLDEGYVVAGSPATVRDRLKELATTLRVGQLMVLLHFGSMPRDLAMENTRRFADAVLPGLRETWPGWEDRWAPRPLAVGGTERQRDGGSSARGLSSIREAGL
jgi:alkanesulfonate monooxygenase SsuD/methylene tetrahydromethanopterin reductase-like flavin-dependent oxidoreductase (luciferase family)